MQNDQFKTYLDKIGEVGVVEKVFQVLLYVSGLPSLGPSELVVFETGEMGQVLSLTPDYAEILLLSNSQVGVGTKVARTGSKLTMTVGPHLLGQTIDPLGEALFSDSTSKNINIYSKNSETRALANKPLGISSRKNITTPFETGVTLVDLIVSLGKGQRELLVGDRKNGKSSFIMQCAMSAVSKGIVVIYASIAQRRGDIVGVKNFFEKNGVMNKAVIIATSSADPSSMVFITPYTALTVAEYFRDLGQDVLVILDDMTAHAKYYREITLLAKRFPGRSSYPGDIFYIHAELMERAGNFVINKKASGGKLERQEVSITCLPIAELVMGDLSGYIQTNLMSMTDGHIYFDIDLYNQGRRPSVNPFLSVTRVGRQAQTPLIRDMSRKLTKFLVRVRELEKFMHFGTELGEDSRRDLILGERIRFLFNQPNDLIVPINVSVLMAGGLWSGHAKDASQEEIRVLVGEITKKYRSDENFKKFVDTLVSSTNTFDELKDKLRDQSELFKM